MLSPSNAQDVLRRLFRRRRVVDLHAVFKTLKTTSTMTAFRRLKELDYLSSYSHAGRFYTLADIAEFDADGLWLQQGVGFSRHGTLKQTVPVLVGQSEAGLFHRELQGRLQVRVHNTLLELVQAGTLSRERFAGEYLYVSGENARAGEQLARRCALRPAAAVVPAVAPPSVVLEILLEVIHAARVRGNPQAVFGRLSARGVTVTLEQVEGVFREHGLPEKKTARSPSRRSRR